jgi:hypothetical protein
MMRKPIHAKEYLLLKHAIHKGLNNGGLHPVDSAISEIHSLLTVKARDNQHVKYICKKIGIIEDQ